MTDVEEQIKEMDEIIKTAIETTPEFLKGLLIPDSMYSRFLSLINSFMKGAREGKKYFKLMMEGEAVREKMKLDFVMGICELVSKKKNTDLKPIDFDAKIAHKIIDETFGEKSEIGVSLVETATPCGVINPQNSTPKDQFNKGLEKRYKPYGEKDD